MTEPEPQRTYSASFHTAGPNGFTPRKFEKSYFFSSHKRKWAGQILEAVGGAVFVEIFHWSHEIKADTREVPTLDRYFVFRRLVNVSDMIGWEFFPHFDDLVSRRGEKMFMWQMHDESSKKYG